GSVSMKLPHNCYNATPSFLSDNTTLHTKSYRFDEHSGIGRLAQHINDGKAALSLKVLTDPTEGELSFYEPDDFSIFRQLLKQKVDKYYRQLQNEFSPAQAFDILEQFRILAAHRKGPWGVGYINKLIEQMLREGEREAGFRTWYAGKPVIVNTNDYTLELYNGDIGLCLPNAAGELRIFFKTEDHFKEILPGRLPSYSTAYALTIHKSQGSEFNRLLLILPSTYSRIVSRELIYTAITRARTGIEVVGTEKSLREGIKTKLQRTSGLSERLWGK